jgi:hypothetical protein
MDALQQQNQKRPSSKRKKPEKIVISPGDPEAAVGQAEGLSAAVQYTLIYDLDCPMITAYDVYPWQNDAGTMEPILKRQRHARQQARHAAGRRWLRGRPGRGRLSRRPVIHVLGGVARMT